MNKKLQDIRKYRRENRIKYNISISDDANQAFLQLYQQRDDATISQVFADAVRFAVVNGMYEQQFRPINYVEQPPKEEKKRKPKEVQQERKEMWCQEFGGSLDAQGTCHYKRYEVAMSGEIVKSDRSQPIRTMPDNRDDFKRVIIGSFTTVTEAETAYQNQHVDDELEHDINARKKADRVPKDKKAL